MLEDTGDILTCKAFLNFLKTRNIHFRVKTSNENKQLKEKKHVYLIYTWSDKVFKSTVVNRALSSLQGGSLGITLTVPLSSTHLASGYG